MTDPIEPVAAPPEVHPIAALRETLGMTQLEFGEQIGLANKASVSLLERGLAPCSLRVALAIEALSGGRIDAAALSEDVRLSRHGHDDGEGGAGASTGQSGEKSGQVLA